MTLKNYYDIKITPLLETLRLEKISDSIYFSEKYNGYISNSRLGLLNPKQNGSPESFFEGFKQIGFASSLELGSAVHEITLQNDLFELAPNLNKPTAKLGAVADKLYPIYLKRNITIEDLIDVSNKVDYFKNKINEKKFTEVTEKCKNYWELRKDFEKNNNSEKSIIYLDYRSREIALSCIESLSNNKKAQELLHPIGLIDDPITENEQAILLDVEVNCPGCNKFILRLKSKLDNYTIDFENNIITINDIKTLGRYLSEFNDNIEKYHYSREIAMYSYLLKLCASKFYNMHNPDIKANYLVVSTVPNFYSKVQTVTYKEIQEGFHEFKTLLKYVAYLIAYKGYSFK